ncbi:MAG: PQQ-binding-like beta-propeller repeat protein [candidate division Zixibacteria bacterium]|nr:PQQ-binding-like beta-propeller repeat protein [candidate division Zixibacteria bacterium]
MLRRLIIAVFVLGLVIGLSSTAISDVSKGELNPVIKIDASNPRFNAIVDGRPEQPAFKKPESALRKVEPGLSMPGTPYLSFCDVQDYTSGAPYYYWPIPDAYGDDLFNMRFTTEDGYDCTLYFAHLLMYGSVMTGTPDLRVYLWDDNGFGFPGNKLDSVDILYALLPTSGLGYASADFTAGGWMFGDGDEYHYGWTTLQSGPGDTLAIISDQAEGPYAGEERASEYIGGVWGTMLNDWGLDVSFFILSERCCNEIPYSVCTWHSYYAGAAYIWAAPHDVYGDEAYSMRFGVSTPETLVQVDLMVYDAGNGTFGNDDVIVTIWGDDAGLPDAANPPIYQVTVPAGTYPAFPTWTSVPFGGMINGDFHVAFSTSATVDLEYCLSDDGTAGVGRSASYWAGGPWVDMLNGWGLDCNFMFEPYTCRDEFETCSDHWCYTSVDYFWRLPDAYGDFGHAQRFSSVGSQCRVQEVAIALYDNGTPTAYTTSSEVYVWHDAGGLPGAVADQVTLNPGDYVLFPAMQIVATDAYISGDYWVGIVSNGTDSIDGIRTMSDAGGGIGACVDSWAEYWGAWSTMCTYWGVGCDWNMVIEATHCCVPYTGLDCSVIPAGAPVANYPTWNGDQARTGHSYVETGDSWCDMSLLWNFKHANGVSMTAPVIYDNRVVCSFTDEYIVFDITTGLPVYTFYPMEYGTPGNVRCAPTIAVVPGFNSDLPVMFLTGGSNGEIFCLDFATGTKLWARANTTVTPAEMFGSMRWGNFIVLGQNLYWGSEGTGADAAVVGIDIPTGGLPGAIIPGFPVYVTQSTWISGATDGTQLFYSTRATAAEGDIYAIDAATGVINWQLSVPPAGGLQAVNIYTHTNGYVGDEGFTGGIAYDAGLNMIYANSRAEADHPTDGLFYRIHASDGTIEGDPTVANRVFYSTPIVDQNRVIMPSLTRWMGPPAGGNLYAVNKFTGSVDWTEPGSASGGRYYSGAVMSCEPEPTPDLVYAFTEDGFFHCVNGNTGEELWQRRGHSVTPGQGVGVALGLDELGKPILVTADLIGNLFVLKDKDIARPRLEIQTYVPQIAVEFGGQASVLLSAPSIFTNTGCADLIFNSVIADTDPFGTVIFNFAASNTKVDFMDRAANIANDISRSAFLSKYLTIDEGSIETIRDFSNERMTNTSAAGMPDFINGINYPTNGTVLAAGDSADLVVDVIQANINRGPQSFYVQLCTNDPDYFLDDTLACPEMYVTLVGGCLIDTTTLHFGIGEANAQHVTNTGRLGTGDWGDGASGFNCFLIDGDGATYYQGSYGWWADDGDTLGHRMATNSQDWTQGGGEVDAFVSMQPDPNWCDGECKPALQTGVTLGHMTNDDGGTYDPILGNMVCKSWVDSVQNFDLGYGWDWGNFGAPFDAALSMGLYCNSRVVGAIDVPELANLTLEIMEITERNGLDLPNWYMGEYFDCDAGNDTIFIDRDISTSWFFNESTMDMAFGQVKIPFGCGYEPSINVWGTSGVNPGQGFWDWAQFWDAAWGYVTAGPGIFSDGDMGAGDEEAFVTLAQHDFVGDETYEIGVVHFQLFGLADASSSAELVPMANLVNQWAGFGRGDVNNDGMVNLADIIYLAITVADGTPGAIPFQHLSDVDGDPGGLINIDDVYFLIDFYFNGGDCPVGAFAF